MKQMARQTQKGLALVLSAMMLTLCLIPFGAGVSAAEGDSLYKGDGAYGDVDGDGQVNMYDVMALYGLVSGQTTDPTGVLTARGDMNVDGAVNMNDLTKLYRCVTGKQVAVPPLEPSEYELEVWRLVNIEREKEGLAPLAYSYEWQILADTRADELLQYFSHYRPNGEICFTVTDDFGADVYLYAENIADGQQTPAEVVEDWMNSPGHRQNIMNPDYSYLIVGQTGGRYGAWVQLFY